MLKSTKTKLLFASVSPAALALVGSAGAADLPRKAPAAVVAPAPIPYSWTGCYVGLSGGYGWGKQNVNRNQFVFSSGSVVSGSSANIGFTTHGGVFGGQIGCNYQFASNWLVGVEGAFAGANIHKDVLDPFTGGTLTAKTNFLGSAVARLGYLTWNNQMLWYVKGGMGAARNKLETSLDLVGGVNNDRVGWTVGAGWEYMFAPSWSVFIDYQYYGFNSGNNNNGGIPAVFSGTVDTISAGSQHINVLKGGVNWKFTGP
jgi:outer membrane immunogenic protein